MSIAILEYGAGNAASVERAFQRLGAATRRAAAPADLACARAIVLPGVGHFGALARALRDTGLLAALQTALDRQVPYLGICLGMQALYESSLEAPEERGLGVFRGSVVPLPADVKLPHMGWNQLRTVAGNRLLRGLSPESHFYFAHSYAVVAPGGEAAAFCSYGREFAAAVEQGSRFGVQFHPEKSGAAGAQVLRNFLECVG